MSKHTPGPWSYNYIGSHGYCIYEGATPGGKHIGLSILYKKDGGEANARLIAAAPDLLEALRVVLNSDMAMREEDEGQTSKTLDVVRAAIAKASA